MGLNGTKHDSGKPPMELLPWEAVEGVAQVLDHGRTKYSAHNWRGGFVWGRLAGAALRHLFAWLSGQDKDSESGLSHVDHAACCLMFLSAHIKSGLGRDDRHCAEGGATPARIGYQWFCQLLDFNESPRWHVSHSIPEVFVTKQDANVAFEDVFGCPPPYWDGFTYELREVPL